MVQIIAAHPAAGQCLERQHSSECCGPKVAQSCTLRGLSLHQPRCWTPAGTWARLQRRVEAAWFRKGLVAAPSPGHEQGGWPALGCHVLSLSCVLCQSWAEAEAQGSTGAAPSRVWFLKWFTCTFLLPLWHRPGDLWCCFNSLLIC